MTGRHLLRLLLEWADREPAARKKRQRALKKLRLDLLRCSGDSEATRKVLLEFVKRELGEPASGKPGGRSRARTLGSSRKSPGKLSARLLRLIDQV